MSALYLMKEGCTERSPILRSVVLCALLKGRSIKRFSRAGIARTLGCAPQSHTPPFPSSVIDVVAMGRTSRVHPFSYPSARD